jgi:hypothetical protein
MHRRREFARWVTVALSLGAGCTTSPETTDTPTEPPRQDCPERPSDVDRPTAGEFVVAFERAYAWNHALASADHVSDIDLQLDTPPAVESVREGYRVTIDEVFVGVSGSMGMADESYIANYYVADDQLLRAESQTEPVDAREEGTEPTCRPE